MSFTPRCVQLIFAGIWLTASPLFAQLTGSTVVGVVTDPSGAVLPNVEVHCLNVGTNVTSNALTNEAGYYEIPSLPAGRYVLTAVLPGFQTSKTEQLQFFAGTRPKVDIQMVVGQVNESVEVTSSATLVNATTTDLGVVIDSQKVLDLPLNGRNFTQLVGLQPGFNNGSFGAQRGGVAEFNGLPAQGNNWLMDGVDISFGENNGVGVGAVGGPRMIINTISIDAIEEFKTTAGAFSAEYGRATGGVINVTTRSGTNRFHGTLFHFFRNDALDANTFFNNRSNLPRPALRHNQFGGNLDGPIWKDKLFFFFNYEQAIVRRAMQLTGNVPTPLLLGQIKNPTLRGYFEGYPQTFEPTSNPLIGLHRRNDLVKNDETTTLSRLDAFLGQHRLSFRLAWNDQLVSNPVLRPGYRESYPTPLKNWTASDFITISPTLSNEIRVGYNHWPIARNTASANPAENELRPGLPVPLSKRGFTEGAVVVGGLTRADYMDLLASDTPTYSFVDNLTWIRGSHTLKAGAEIRRVNSMRTQIGQGVVHTYNTVDDLINDRIFSLLLPFGNPGDGFQFWTTGFYVQDDWRASRRLQVNLGLRYEYYTPFSGPFGLTTTNIFGPRNQKGDAIWKPDRNNFAPRVGLVYDLTGKGTTVLRTGAAVSYASPIPFPYYDMAWVDPKLPAFPTINRVDLAAFEPITFPFPYSFVENVRQNPSLAPAGLIPVVQAPNPERRDEYSIQWNFSLQHSLTHTFAVTASYVGNRALKLFASRLYNGINPQTGVRPNPQFAASYLYENAGRSWNHGLQLGANKRLSRGLTFDVYYTWSRTMQYYAADSTYNPLADSYTQDFDNIAGSIGPKPGEINHRATVVHSYQLPTPAFVSNSKLGQAFLGGWTAQGILGASTGQPLNIVLGRDVLGYGRAAGQRPDAVPGQDWRASSSDRFVWLNRAAFDANTPQEQRRFGSLGFNTARGPGAFTWDLGIHKTFSINEAHRIMFRFEMFNWLNHMNPSNPDRNMTSPTFGMITAGGDSRNIQLALKYSF